MTTSCKNSYVKIGTIIKTGFLNGIYKHADEYSDNGTKIVRINDYENNGRKNFKKLRRVDLSESEIKKFMLLCDDILINRVNSLSHIGKSCIVTESKETMVFESNIMRLRLQKNAGILPRYLSVILHADRSRDFLRRVAKPAVAQASINQEDVKALSIFLPDLEQQNAIADLLSSWGKAIEKIEQLIMEKEKRFYWLRDTLITKESQNSRWRIVRLGEIFSERMETKCDDLPLLSITREQGVILRDDVGRKDTSNDDKAKYLRICPGDIGYNTMRMWQGVSALSSLEGIISPAYTVCIPSEKVHGEFIAHMFKTPYMIHQFYRYSQGLTSDTWNLKFKHFKDIKVSIPPLERQKKIAETLNTVKEEIGLLKKQTETYRKQKRGLMQKLLTGEWRVKLKDELQGLGAASNG